ncbi:unnamed protein product [Didymodactylos carnosus]|uniref:Uncharacterized protein n=1 Tax=Didymodactylos carnosus TaxID=1234261 RepID=A0A8S2ERY7_9BILA|nr:unnamed protein product [Didymodactylos carnosus]CAF4030877.1 unnamed protein product [Didymodactylos carnosus]
MANINNYRLRPVNSNMSSNTVGSGGSGNSQYYTPPSSSSVAGQPISLTTVASPTWTYSSPSQLARKYASIAPIWCHITKPRQLKKKFASTFHQAQSLVSFYNEDRAPSERRSSINSTNNTNNSSNINNHNHHNNNFSSPKQTNYDDHNYHRHYPTKPSIQHYNYDQNSTTNLNDTNIGPTKSILSSSNKKKYSGGALTTNISSSPRIVQSPVEEKFQNPGERKARIDQLKDLVFNTRVKDTMVGRTDSKNRSTTNLSKKPTSFKRADIFNQNQTSNALDNDYDHHYHPPPTRNKDVDAHWNRKDSNVSSTISSYQPPSNQTYHTHHQSHYQPHSVTRPHYGVGTTNSITLRHNPMNSNNNEERYNTNTSTTATITPHSAISEQIPLNTGVTSTYNYDYLRAKSKEHPRPPFDYDSTRIQNPILTTDTSIHSPSSTSGVGTTNPYRAFDDHGYVNKVVPSSDKNLTYTSVTSFPSYQTPGSSKRRIKKYLLAKGFHQTEPIVQNFENMTIEDGENEIPPTTITVTPTIIQNKNTSSLSPPPIPVLPAYHPPPLSLLPITPPIIDDTNTNYQQSSNNIIYSTPNAQLSPEHNGYINRNEMIDNSIDVLNTTNDSTFDNYHPNPVISNTILSSSLTNLVNNKTKSSQFNSNSLIELTKPLNTVAVNMNTNTNDLNGHIEQQQQQVFSTTEEGYIFISFFYYWSNGFVVQSDCYEKKYCLVCANLTKNVPVNKLYSTNNNSIFVYIFH